LTVRAVAAVLVVVWRRMVQPWIFSNLSRKRRSGFASEPGYVLCARQAWVVTCGQTWVVTWAVTWVVACGWARVFTCGQPRVFSGETGILSRCLPRILVPRILTPSASVRMRMRYGAMRIPGVRAAWVLSLEPWIFALKAGILPLQAWVFPLHAWVLPLEAWVLVLLHPWILASA